MGRTSELLKRTVAVAASALMAFGVISVGSPGVANAACNSSFSWSTSSDPVRTAGGGWCIQRSGSALHKVVFQSDGNLVYYKGNTVIWNSKTSGWPSAVMRFKLDGNVVIYKSSSQQTSAGVLWASASSGSCSGQTFNTTLEEGPLSGGQNPTYWAFTVGGCSIKRFGAATV